MNVVRYDPWTMFERLNSDLNTLLQSRQAGSLEDSDDSRVVTSRWTPAVDISEEEDRFVLSADVPGVDPKDIEITMEDNVLSIRGERHHEQDEVQNGYRRIERIRGGFYRRFSLPDTADAERISAHSEHGVLNITIPKKEQVKPRRIEIGISD